MSEVKKIITKLKEDENLTDKEKLLLQLVEVLDGEIELVKEHSEFVRKHSDKVISIINS